MLWFARMYPKITREAHRIATQPGFMRLPLNACLASPMCPGLKNGGQLPAKPRHKLS